MKVAGQEKAKFDALKARMIELHNEGMASVDIAKKLGKNPSNINKWLRAQGIEPILKCPEQSKNKTKTGKFAGLK